MTTTHDRQSNMETTQTLIQRNKASAAGQSPAVLFYGHMMSSARARILLSLLIGLIAALLAFQSNDVSVLVASSRALLSGASPYHVDQFVSPLSTAVLFIPFAPLPNLIVLRAVAFISVALFAYVILRESRRWWIALLLMCTPIFLYDVYSQNIEGAIFASLLMSPPLAFLLALVKPQVGLGVALVALLVVWKKNKPLALLLIALEACIFAASFAAGMDWSKQLHGYGNFGVFPYGLILGLPLLITALRRRDMVMALAALPFCSPYVGPQSWIAVLPFTARLSNIACDRLRRRPAPGAG